MVRDLYRRLCREAWIDPWLDEEKLLPGQDWDLEIEKAVESSGAVIVCLSSRSVTKEGYIQKELRKVLDIALEKPEETLFIIPLRLDDCELPRRLRSWHYVDYFPADRQDWAFLRMLEALKVRYNQASLGVSKEENIEPVSSKSIRQEFEPMNFSSAVQPQADAPQKSKVDLAGFLLLLVYLLIETFAYLGDSSAFLDYSRLALAVPTGLYFLLRRQLPASRIFKVAFSLFLISQSILLYLQQGGYAPDMAWPILGVVALVTAGALVSALQVPAKPAVYSSILIAVYFFLVAIEVVLQAADYYGSPIFLIQIILSIVIIVLLWMDL